MKFTITARNFKTSKYLENMIEKKFEKLEKYFSDDINANIVLSRVKDRETIEVTINAKGAVFRTEETGDDIFECLDIAVDRLSTQMSRFKGKMQRRWQDNRSVRFEEIPSAEDDVHPEVGRFVKVKKFDLMPMTAEEAVLQMEMLQHDFFIYLDMDTDSVNVVYKRKDNNYGRLETTY